LHKKYYHLKFKALPTTCEGFNHSVCFFTARTFKTDMRLKHAHFNQSVDLFNICGTSSSIFKIILAGIDWRITD